MVALSCHEKSLKKRLPANKQKSVGNQSRQQPWYNKSLRQQRQDLLSKAHLLAKYPNDPIVRGRYLTALKSYHKNCKKTCRLHRQQLIDKLNSLYDSNPKAYWELVKKLKNDDKDSANKISPSDWLDHFQSLGKQDNFNTPEVLPQLAEELANLEQIKNFTELDFKISKDEITKGIQNLKNGKTLGPDGICNELLKHSTHVMLEPLDKTFNLVLSSGIYPDSWARVFIKPIHKKEDPLEPNNYRGITMTSVMGKIFNAILNTRIIKFVENNRIMKNEQIGFRFKCRTSLSSKQIYTKEVKGPYTHASSTSKRPLTLSHTLASSINYLK